MVRTEYLFEWTLRTLTFLDASHWYFTAMMERPTDDDPL